MSRMQSKYLAKRSCIGIGERILVAAWLPTHGDAAFVVPTRDGQDGVMTVHHKDLKVMNFRLKQSSAL